MTWDNSNIQHKYPIPKLLGLLYLIGGKADVPQLQNGSQDSPGGAQLIIWEADSLQSLHQDQEIPTVLFPQDVTCSALREKGQIIVISPFSLKQGLSHHQESPENSLRDERHH